MKNKNENKEKNPLLLLKRLLSYIVKNYNTLFILEIKIWKWLNILSHNLVVQMVN